MILARQRLTNLISKSKKLILFIYDSWLCLMNLNQLKLFYLAIKHGNLGVAAIELNITQPAVTKGIQRLQEFYEVKLVNREGRQLSLTSAGKELYKIADKIFETEKLAEECLLCYQQKETDHIRIHAGESVGAYYLPPIINRFNKNYPGIRVTVDIVSNQLVIEKTLDLQNTFGCISKSISDKKLIVQNIQEDQLVVIVPPDHPLAEKRLLAPADFEKQIIIMHEEGTVLHDFINDLKEKYKIAISTHVTLSNNEAIKKAVELGSGIALISIQAVQEEIKTKRLVAIPLSEKTVNRMFRLIYHKDKYLSGPARQLIDLILQ